MRYAPLVAALALTACAPKESGGAADAGGGSDSPGAPDGDSEAGDSSPPAADSGGDGGGGDGGGSGGLPVEPDPGPPTASFSVSPADAGPFPFTARFSAAGSEVHTGAGHFAWDFGDGATGEGVEVEHTYLSVGTPTARLTVSDALGRTDEASLGLTVEWPPCPTAAKPLELGAVEDDVIDEASGLAESRQSPGVLWLHNDSGGSARLFAIDTAGALLATVWLKDATNGDWEDLSLLNDPATGIETIVVGDVGDNARRRETVIVYLVDEPLVTPGQEYEELTVATRRLELDYPDDEYHDVEALLADPVSGDLMLVTKDYEGETYLFRKPAPHKHGALTTLELAGSLDFAADPLSGNATTAGDVSPLGDRIIIRTYSTRAYIWRRDAASGLAEALAGEPCEVVLPAERQGETVAFSADGAALYTVSEGDHQPVWLTPLE